eukprot:5552044-Pyramimonas_sp.AAC.1
MQCCSQYTSTRPHTVHAKRSAATGWPPEASISLGPPASRLIDAATARGVEMSFSAAACGAE